MTCGYRLSISISIYFLWGLVLVTKVTFNSWARPLSRDFCKHLTLLRTHMMIIKSFKTLLYILITFAKPELGSGYSCARYNIELAMHLLRTTPYVEICRNYISAMNIYCGLCHQSASGSYMTLIPTPIIDI